MVAHLHDRLSRFMVLRHAGKSQEVTHGHIVDAFQAHDIDAARQALLEDIDNTREAILDMAMRKGQAPGTWIPSEPLEKPILRLQDSPSYSILWDCQHRRGQPVQICKFYL